MLLSAVEVVDVVDVVLEVEVAEANGHTVTTRFSASATRRGQDRVPDQCHATIMTSISSCHEYLTS